MLNALQDGAWDMAFLELTEEAGKVFGKTCASKATKAVGTRNQCVSSADSVILMSGQRDHGNIINSGMMTQVVEFVAKTNLHGKETVTEIFDGFRLLGRNNLESIRNDASAFLGTGKECP
jgi:hypothetical protein